MKTKYTYKNHKNGIKSKNSFVIIKNKKILLKNIEIESLKKKEDKKFSLALKIDGSKKIVFDRINATEIIITENTQFMGSIRFTSGKILFYYFGFPHNYTLSPSIIRSKKIKDLDENIYNINYLFGLRKSIDVEKGQNCNILYILIMLLISIDNFQLEINKFGYEIV
jgi:hypothetical protein